MVVDVDFWLVSVKHVGAGPILRQLSEPPGYVWLILLPDKEEGEYLPSVTG